MKATSVALMVIFFPETLIPSLITAMFKVLSQRLRGNLKTTFERHLTIDDYTDMGQHRCQACAKTFDLLLYPFLSLIKPSFYASLVDSFPFWFLFKLRNPLNDSNLQITAYNFVRVDHPSDTKRRDVCLYCIYSFYFEVIDVSYLQECIDSEVKIGDKTCNFISFYMSNVNFIKNFKLILQLFVNKSTYF